MSGKSATANDRIPMTLIERSVELAYRSVPILVLFSLFFAFEGGMRWLGLLGLVPLALWAAGCRTCGGRRGGGESFPCF